MTAGNMGPTILATMFTMLGLSTVFVSLRVYCRAFIIGAISIDDWLIVAALINAWGLGVINYFHVFYGTGTHMADLTNFDQIIVPTLKLWYGYQLQYIVVLYFVKASILSFYCRLSPKRSYQISVWLTFGVISVYTVAMLLVNIFECPKNPSRAWSPEFPKGCNNLVTVYYAMAAFNILSDVVILCLPIPTLLGLQINKRKRTALVLIFSCGAFSVISSIVRISALFRYQNAVNNMGDIPYEASFILLWSQVEINTAICSTSAPSIKPLLRSVLGGTTVRRSYQHDLNNLPSGSGSKSKPKPHLSSYMSRQDIPEGMGIPLTKTKCHTVIRSEESDDEALIFGNDNNTSREGIVRTMDVTVDIEARSVGRESLRDDTSATHGVMRSERLGF